MRGLGFAAILYLTSCAYGQDAYNAGITVSPGERYFAVGNGEKDIRLFSLRTGKQIRVFRTSVADYGHLTKPAFSPDGKYMTAGSLHPDGCPNYVWRVSDGKVIARIGLRTSKDEFVNMHVVGFSSDGKYVLGALYGQHDEVLAYETAGWRHAYFKQIWQEPGRAVAAVCPNGSLIATHTTQLLYWDPVSKSDEEWQDFIVEPDNVCYMTFSGDGKKLTLAGDGWCCTIDPARFPKSLVVGDGMDTRYRPVKTATIPNFIVRSVGSSYDGKRAFIGSRDGRIAKFDMTTGKLTKMWKAFAAPVKGLAVTRDGTTLLSYDLTHVKYWTTDGKLKKTIQTN